MTFFVGHRGAVTFKRALSTQYAKIEDTIDIADITTRLNRLSFDKATDNLITGDRVTITTSDPRKLAFLPPSAWRNNQLQSSISCFINVNLAGGLRLFRTFDQAVNNDRLHEISLIVFSGEPLPITVTVRDTSHNILGDVESYQFYTDRESIDTTALQDKFKQQYTAGLLSGGGSIDCIFNYKSTGFKETSLFLVQLIHRIDIGSEFDLALYLIDNKGDRTKDDVYYSVNAMITKAGAQVTANDIIRCSIDFVSVGEIRLLVGRPSAVLLKEDGEPIGLEQSSSRLGQQMDD
jgi:hypothetical protein